MASLKQRTQAREINVNPEISILALVSFPGTSRRLGSHVAARTAFSPAAAASRSLSASRIASRRRLRSYPVFCRYEPLWAASCPSWQDPRRGRPVRSCSPSSGCARPLRRLPPSSRQPVSSPPLLTDHRGCTTKAHKHPLPLHGMAQAHPHPLLCLPFHQLRDPFHPGWR